MGKGPLLSGGGPFLVAGAAGLMGSVLPLVGEGLIEVDLGPGIGGGGIDRRGLIERDLGLRRSAVNPAANPTVGQTVGTLTPSDT